MDWKEELTLLVHMPKQIVKLKKFSNGLYAMDLNNKNSFVLIKEEHQFMNTLEENLKCLSSIQQNQAKQAQDGNSQGG